MFLLKEIVGLKNIYFLSNIFIYEIVNILDHKDVNNKHYNVKEKQNTGIITL